MNYYPIYQLLEERGRMAVELNVAWDETGRLTTAMTRTYGRCPTEGQAGCTNLNQRELHWFLIPPVHGGHEYYDIGKIQSGGAYRILEGPDAPLTVDFTTLLAGTTWNEPVW